MVIIIKVTCKDAVIEAVKELGGVVSAKEVIDWIYRKYPDKPWKQSSIRAHLIGLSVNHPSSKHHPTLHHHACLFYLGGGRYKLHLEKDNIDAHVEGDDSLEDVDSDEDIEATISLEKDLEEYIIRNLNQIENGLELYSKKGITGRQFSTDVGRMDILAIDKDGNFLVIELKAGTARYSVIGQILGYISWVRQNISQGRGVRGIIIADDFDKKLKYASSEIPNIFLKKYEVTFTLKDVQI
ncbi:MAG: endonuclease NucS [Candidatus Thermoplasmatota archaeon]|nr:endonuclease NucS [Candidatus Thermoplasmatota archaeon]MCL5963848.1 endonuclease NucS [Candidatus Thermoplasmatota archaeon]